MVVLVTSYWNQLCNEINRWISLLEKSSLTNHIPYGLGTVSHV